MQAVLLFVFGVFAIQSTNAQCIRSSPVIATAPIVPSNAVATTLADTLSLLTVSSLLAEKLPFDYPCGCDPYIPYGPYVAPYDPYVAPYDPYVPPCGPYIPPCGPYIAPCDPYVPPCGPYIPPCGPSYPMPTYAPYEVISPFAPIEIAPIVNNCGCGCNGYGYPYNSYVL